MARSIALIIIGFLALACRTAADAAVVYSQPHNGTGTLYQSSWLAPDDHDSDQFVWDSFILPTSEAITEIHWRGGFDPTHFGMGGPVEDFTVEIYASTPGLVQPDLVNPPLVSYLAGGNAGQTPAGTFGTTAMYDYAFTLPSPFQATAGVRYWVQIEAWQHGLPDWGFAAGTGGNGSHFRFIRGAAQYQTITGDTAFSLLTADAPTAVIAATASPGNGGTIQGAGSYPVGSTASLVAAPNAGFAFLNWTENGQQVSTSATYAFTVTVSRTLVANFAIAHTITTNSLPSYGGTTAGGGVFAIGTQATVIATAHHGFVFTQWLDYGTPVSTSPSYSFIVDGDHLMTAQFASAPNAVTYNFDDAPVYTSLPIDLTVNGLTAHFAGTFYNYSIQPANTFGITPPGFEGLCIFPNTGFLDDLHISFSQTLVDFSVLYSPLELGCDDSATMRVTAYMNDVFVATNTTTAQFPGTYPSETLSIVAPAGFNRVVVHYDSHPPTCQDWGPNFRADNVTVTRAAAAPCPADVSQDGSVNVTDLLAVIGAWGACANCPPTRCAADVAPFATSGDCQVNVSDLLAVIGAWGVCP